LNERLEKENDMDIAINKTWRLTSDPANIILQRWQVAQKGKTAGQGDWVNVGYYGDIPAALSGYSRHTQKTFAGKGWDEFNLHMKQVAEDIQAIRRTLEGESHA
jgi:ferritin-like protein